MGGVKNPTMITWIGWLSATVVATAVFCSFAYTNFQTKDNARDDKEDLKSCIRDLKDSVDKLNQKVDDLKDQL